MGIQNKLVSISFFQLLAIVLVLESGNAQYLKQGFYNQRCPDAEAIITKTTHQYISRAPTLAAALLRMHFHDCFVRGCDGSVLLDSKSNNQAEKDSIPNKTLRGFDVINAAKSALENKCPGVVSCADILALAARDAVAMINGPYWEVPTGRRDGKVSRASEALENLPSPFGDINHLKSLFIAKGLTVKDLAVLSGGHTIGISHCPAVLPRLYNFTGKGDADPSLDPNYAAELRKKCKPGDTTSIVEMDPGSFKSFDADYFSIVAKRRGLFQSDAALLDDKDTKAYVNLQINTHGSTFATDFAASMANLGQIEVLTGKSGEIRRKCAFVN